ncbi:MAG: heparinase II/III family protein, partial [Planctomycetes bacterium]|nr:heparinase II/III family protein [Planctomycetota bacterium]
DLPTSRCFWGTGQAMLNTNLLDGRENVEIIFKSSPFGSQSHGYESQNAFLLYAFGERLLIRTGRRDSHGSEHHREWMWHTKSVNSITVNGEGQGHSSSATGEIVSFHTSDSFDYVAGEAGQAYGDLLKRFTRSILFVKPELVVVYDRLEAPEPSLFDWRLHSPTEMVVRDQEQIQVVNGNAACRVSFLAPPGLKLSVTDKFDTPPRPRIKLVEWHLTARTPEPTRRMEFVTVIRPHRTDQTPPTDAALENIEGGYALEAETSEGRVVVLMRSRGGAELRYGSFSTAGDLAAIKLDRELKPVDSLVVEGETVRTERP